MSDGATDITVHPIHLGLGATAEVEPEFTGGTGDLEGITGTGMFASGANGSPDTYTFVLTAPVNQ